MSQPVKRQKAVDPTVAELSVTTLYKSFSAPQQQQVKIAALVIDEFQRQMAWATEDIAWMMQDGIPVPINAQDLKFLKQATMRVGKLLDDLKAVDQLAALLFASPSVGDG